MSKKEIRSAKEWAEFFINDKDWVSCTDEYLGNIGENDVKNEIIDELGGGVFDRIPTVKKLDELKIKNRIAHDFVEIIKPFDINVDGTTSDLNRIPSVDENGEVTNLMWTNYKVVDVICEVECPEDDVNGCMGYACSYHDCLQDSECAEFSCNEFDCSAYDEEECAVYEEACDMYESESY